MGKPRRTPKPGADPGGAASERGAGSVRWAALPVADALARLAARPSGLAEAEVRARLAEFGWNRLLPPRRRGALVRLALQFHNVLIYVLLAASVVTAVLAQWVDTGVILAVVVINAVVGFVQEGRAERSLEAVQGLLSSRASVVRDGRRIAVAAEGVVPGDIVTLQPGDKVPADLRLLEARALRIQEAALTGESMPADKSAEPVAADAPLGDQASMAFSGTLVVAGQGTGVAVRTGLRTEVGRISALLSAMRPLTTPLLRRMTEFGRWLAVVILVLCALFFALGTWLRPIPAEEMFMIVVGLAVAAIPEGLPPVMTIALALGVRRVARRNAIIRRLPAVETLGSVTVICTDKTGTLTRNELTARTIATASARYEASGTGYDPHGGLAREGREISPMDEPDLAEAVRAFALCNDSALRQADGAWRVDGDPTEGALLTLALKAGMDPEDEAKRLPRTDAIPFDPSHRFMATLHHDHEGHGVIIVKGAPERLIEMCHAERAGGHDRPIRGAHWQDLAASVAASGQRVLAVGCKPTRAAHRDLRFADVEHGLTLLGLAGLMDLPREDAARAIRDCAAAGIGVKMITGDHALTASAVARQLGMAEPDRVLAGNDLERLHGADFDEAVRATNVFARTSPEDKLRLVEALQRDGHVVAMTGDGVNDAPALKRADIGVAMGISGTEVAKEASEMVLADDNFAGIADAVREGRVVYDNLRKTIAYILPTNGGEVLVVMVAVALGLVLPITPVQILWVNLATSVTFALALAFEPAEPDVMARPPRPPSEPLMSGLLWWRIGFVSVLMLMATFGAFLYEQGRGADLAAARTVAVNTLVACEAFYLLSARSVLRSSLTMEGMFGSRAVLVAVSIVVAFQAALTYLPLGHRLFGTADLPAETWLTILAAGALVFAMAEAEKAVARAMARRRRV